MSTICKYCNTPEDKQENPGLICENCICFVHLSCLRRPGTPGDFACDVFFDFTCADCSPDKKEVFTRNRFPWVNVLLLTLHHLGQHSYGISNHGFFHYKTHICSFIDRHWTLLFGPHFKQKKNWIGTIAGALSVYNHLFFRSGSVALGESGWWKLLHNFSPAVASLIIQENARDKPKGRPRNQMALDKTLFRAKVCELGYVDLLNTQPDLPIPGVEPATKKRRLDSDEASAVSSTSYYDIIESERHEVCEESNIFDEPLVYSARDSLYEVDSVFRGFEFTPASYVPPAPVTQICEESNIFDEPLVYSARDSLYEVDSVFRGFEFTPASYVPPAPVTQICEESNIFDEPLVYSARDSLYEVDNVFRGFEFTPASYMPPAPVTQICEESNIFDEPLVYSARDSLYEVDSVFRGFEFTPASYVPPAPVTQICEEVSHAPRYAKRAIFDEPLVYSARDSLYEVDNVFRGFEFTPASYVPPAPVTQSDSSSINSLQHAPLFYDSDARSLSPLPTEQNEEKPDKSKIKLVDEKPIVRRENLFSTELNSVDLPWVNNTPEPDKNLVELSEYEEIQLLKQVENLIPKVKDPNKKAYLYRLKAKLALRRLKRHKHLPIFDIDKTVKLLGGYVPEDPKVKMNVERVLDRFQRSYLIDNLSGTIASTVHGTWLVSHIEPTTFRSAYSGTTLKPYIRRDQHSNPTWLQLTDELLRKTHKNVKNYQPPPRATIDFSYVRPQHIAAVNNLCAQFFWPGIDVTEALEYPEFSCVVTYKKLVVGCAFLVPDVRAHEAYISFLLVRPEWRRAKIATFMLYHLLQTCTGKDVTLHVSPTNPAIFLYQKFGFKVSKDTKNKQNVT
ncbi:acetyltransferase (GNAT) family domain-containing protein [Phthorimaea operculella]|nr:acetyltransferase (GNAT) family domain-containing protein [Phthorimaea operculella]